MIYQDIYDYLITSSALTTLVGQLPDLSYRIFWPDAPEADHDGIVYRSLSNPQIYLGTDTRHELWRFWINDQSPVKCVEIKEELKNMLSDKRGYSMGASTVIYSYKETDLDPILIPDLSTYQAVLDIRIKIL